MVQFKHHRSQWLDNNVVVAGGKGEYSSESCALNGDSGKLECEDISPTLTDYSIGVSFTVASDFCV